MRISDWSSDVCSSDLLGLPLAMLIVWLPRLRSRLAAAPEPVAADTLAELTRDLSYTTSHNALSAAGVAYSVKQLAGKVQSQLDAAAQIVGNAESMIATEQATRSEEHTSELQSLMRISY